MTGKLTAVAVDTGVPLVIALLGTAMMFLRERRKNQTLAKEKQWLALEADNNKKEIEQLGFWIENRNILPSELSGVPNPPELGSKDVRHYK